MSKSKKDLSPRIINAHPLMAGMQRHDFEHIQQVKQSEAQWAAGRASMKSKHI